MERPLRNSRLRRPAGRRQICSKLCFSSASANGLRHMRRISMKVLVDTEWQPSARKEVIQNLLGGVHRRSNGLQFSIFYAAKSSCPESMQIYGQTPVDYRANSNSLRWMQ
jgi:hypothetical protein